MEIVDQINALSTEAQIFPGVIPGRAARTRNLEIPDNVLRTIPE
ncbi:hypothetical protein ACFIOY_14980 [Bradyrhizobium sp. TZ2]